MVHGADFEIAATRHDHEQLTAGPATSRPAGRPYTPRKTPMTKKLSKFAVLAFGLLFSVNAFAAVTVRYYNKDSQSYTWNAVCSGTNLTVTFDSSRTSSTTIQGSGPCTVKTGNGDVQLSDGANITIQNGKITVN